jgi:hypothetical protein
VKSSRRSARRDQADWVGLECALPSRELKLAQTPAPARASIWKKALNWVRSGFGRGPAAV